MDTLSGLQADHDQNAARGPLGLCDGRGSRVYVGGEQSARSVVQRDWVGETRPLSSSVAEKSGAVGTAPENAVKHRKVPRADSVEHEWCKTCGGLHVGLFDKTGRLFAEAVLDVETVMDMN